MARVARSRAKKGAAAVAEMPPPATDTPPPGADPAAIAADDDFEPPQEMVDAGQEPPAPEPAAVEAGKAIEHYFDTLKGKKSIPPERFFEHLPSFPADRFDRAIVYLYRIWPRIDRKQADPTAYNYIDKFTQPFTPDDVKQRWGEGKYQALMLNLDKRTDNQIAGCVFTIDDPAAPPVLNLAELVLGTPSNSSFEEYLRSRNMHPSQQTPPGPPSGEASATSALANLAQQALRAAQQPPAAAALENTTLQGYIQLLKSSVDKPGGMDMAGVAALITAVGNLTKQPAPAGPDPRDQMITQLFGALLKKMDAPPPVAAAPAQGLAEAVAQITSVIELTQKLTPPASNDSVLTLLATNAAPILSEVRGIFQSAVALVRPGAAPAPGAGAQQTQQPQQTQQQTAQQIEEAKAVDMLQLALQTIEPVMIKMFREGSEGWMLAEWIENGYGADNYNRVVNFGKEKIIAELMRRPALQRTFDGLQPQLSTFVDSFLAWPEKKAEFDAAQAAEATNGEEEPTA